MEEMISVCGLLCSDCGAFIANKNDDDEKRTEVAETWSKKYNVDIKPEDINCNGCLSDIEPLFGHCKVCEVRKCGKGKAIENCAHCDEYACEKLEKIFQVVPDTRKRLDQIKNKL